MTIEDRCAELRALAPGWLDGDVETLVFDKLVGFPIEIDGSPASRDWYAEWKAETLAAEL